MMSSHISVGSLGDTKDVKIPPWKIGSEDLNLDGPGSLSSCRTEKSLLVSLHEIQTKISSRYLYARG